MNATGDVNVLLRPYLWRCLFRKLDFLDSLKGEGGQGLLDLRFDHFAAIAADRNPLRLDFLSLG